MPVPPGTTGLPATALVTAAELDAAGVVGGQWYRDSSSRNPVVWPVDPCGARVAAGPTAVAHLSAGSLSTQEGQGLTFSQQVVRHTSPEAATTEGQRLLLDVERCPERGADGQPLEQRLVPVPGSPGLVEVQQVALFDSPTDVEEFEASGLPESSRVTSNWAGVVVEGDLVATWLLDEFHGVPQQDGRAAAALVRAALCRAAGTC